MPHLSTFYQIINHVTRAKEELIKVQQGRGIEIKTWPNCPTIIIALFSHVMLPC